MPTHATDAHPPQDDPSGPGQPAEAPSTRWRVFGHLPVWKKGLLVASVALMAASAVLQGYVYLRPSNDVHQVTPANPELLSTRQFQPDSWPSGQADRASDAPFQGPDYGAEVWSPVMFRMGFGFFVGFCIAYAVRAFLRISAIAGGVVLLMLLTLQYSGIVDVNWTAMHEHYDTATGWLGRQMTSFHQFVTGYLPSSTMAMLGGAVGFIRRRG